jgi:hypothetical protein
MAETPLTDGIYALRNTVSLDPETGSYKTEMVWSVNTSLGRVVVPTEVAGDTTKESVSTETTLNAHKAAANAVAAAYPVG